MYVQTNLMQKKGNGECDVTIMTLLFATRPSCLHQLSVGELPATRVSGVSLFLSPSRPFNPLGRRVGQAEGRLLLTRTRCSLLVVILTK
jgi:hypothetical protein